MENNTNNNKGTKKAKKILEDGPKFNYFWVYAIIIGFIVISFNLSFFQENSVETSMSELKTMLQDNDVEKIIIVNSYSRFVKDFIPLGNC